MARKFIPILLLVLCLLLASSHGRKLEGNVSFVSKLVRATNPRDVQGVGAIVRQFPELRNNLFKKSDDADPCLPMWWTWVACNNDTISPRVTALYLSSRRLSGPIPDFSTMDALERIYMYNNSLTGTIPKFLGTLPKLQTLYLFNNLLSGTVPASIVQNTNLTKGLSGNLALIQLSSPPPREYFKTIPTTLPYPKSGDEETRSVRVRVKFRPLKLIIIGIVLAALLVFFCLVVVFGACAALCGCGGKKTESAEPVDQTRFATTGEEQTKTSESTEASVHSEVKPAL